MFGSLPFEAKKAHVKIICFGGFVGLSIEVKTRFTMRSNSGKEGVEVERRRGILLSTKLKPPFRHHRIEQCQESDPHVVADPVVQESAESSSSNIQVWQWPLFCTPCQFEMEAPHSSDYRKEHKPKIVWSRDNPAGFEGFLSLTQNHLLTKSILKPFFLQRMSRIIPRTSLC